MAWRREPLSRLELRGDETVLDAGCGAGEATWLLLERLPGGRVIAADPSALALARARDALGGDSRVTFVAAELTELELDRPVDAIFSGGAFDRVLDHERLFARLHAQLRPGGALEAECGGEGNLAELERAIEALQGDERFVAYLRGIRKMSNHASVGDTEALLDRAGFLSVRCWLEPRRVEPRDPRAYLRSALLGPQLDRLPARLGDELIDTVLGSMPRPLVLDYVRLNISARRLP